MGFRVIHHSGDKDLLVEKVKVNADQLKNDEKYKDHFDEGWWECAVDTTIKSDFSGRRAPIVLSFVINDNFPPVSEDDFISAYSALSEKTSGKLAETLLMFVNGRNFSTGKPGFGDEMTCGYLTPDEVREFLGLIKAYTPDSTCEGEKEFVDDLVVTFSKLVEKKSGDLFIMS